MSLPKLSGSELYQSLKMRRRRVTQPMLVVEGKTDPVSLVNLIAPAAYLVAAGNRESVIAAHSQFLSSGDPLQSALFVVDCDNRIDSALLGLTSLAVTERRDMESDLLHSLEGMNRVLLPVLLRDLEDVELARAKAQAIEYFISRLSSDLTHILDAGRRMKLGVRLVRQGGRKDRLGFGDLPNATIWCESLTTPTREELITEVAGVLKWDREYFPEISAQSTTNSDKACRIHNLSGCELCRHRTFSNGHDQVALLSGVFTYHLKQAQSPRDIEDRLRSAVRAHDDWSLGRRISKWEKETGKVIRSR